MAKARDRSSRPRAPREIPDAERPKLTLSKNQKKAIERALQQLVPRGVERAARNIPIGRPPERPVSTAKASSAEPKKRLEKPELASAPISPSTPTETPLRHGPQIDRVLRELLIRYPPDGKVPHQETIDTVRAKLSPGWKAENEKYGLIDPSWDVVNAAVKQVGRQDG